MSKAEELLEALNQLVSAAVDLEYPPFAKTPRDMLPYEQRFRIAVSSLPNEAVSQIADHIIALESELSRLRPVVDGVAMLASVVREHFMEQDFEELRLKAIMQLLAEFDAAEKGWPHEG